MKKIFLILASLLPFVTFGGNVSSEQARKIAEMFYSTKTTRAIVSTTLELKWTGGSSVQTRTLQEPAFYVFDNTAGGFVIIAGDDSVEPILGYSDDGEFVVDGMPDNVKYWFDFLQDGIAYLRSTNFTPSAKIQSLWNAYRNGVAPIVTTRAGAGKELETAKWNQTEPFNIKATEWCGFGESVYTGCVATATAIIMRYHKYPTEGTGTIGGYQYTSSRYGDRTIKSYSLGHTYNWDNMPTNNGSGWTTDQKNAVAQLMLDCGVMSEMYYGTYSESGSSAVTSYAPNSLVEYMRYDKSHDALDRVYYERDEWVGKIIENIDNNMPVLFSGRSAQNSGHAFILDGYNSSNEIHINWGWGGNDNGYYTIPEFGDYGYSQTAFINIKPDEGGSEPQPVIGHTGMSFTSGPTIEGETVNMTVYTDRVFNIGSSTFYGKIYLAHADKNDNIKQIIRTYDCSSGLGAGWGYSSLTYSYSVAAKDIANNDKLKWYYTFDDNVYLPLKYDLENTAIKGELPLPNTEDIFDIEDGTSAEYFPVENKLVITSHSGLQYQLMNSGSSEVNTGVELLNGVLTIDLEALSPGTYTLTLKVGSKSKKIQFTTGK